MDEEQAYIEILRINPLNSDAERAELMQILKLVWQDGYDYCDDTIDG